MNNIAFITYIRPQKESDHTLIIFRDSEPKIGADILWAKMKWMNFRESKVSK